LAPGMFATIWCRLTAEKISDAIVSAG
jgi:hypothetical protein